MFDLAFTAAARPAPVVFLSGALGAAGEWIAIADALGPDFDPDRHSDPARGVEALAAAPTGAHVVAYGTSAHPAILAAATAPWLVRSLTLIDPDIAPALPDLDGVYVHRPAFAMRSRIAVFTAEGDAWNAAREAVDFWMGKGAFLRSSATLQNKVASRIGRLCAAYALQAARPLDIYALAGVVCPALLLTGRKAPAELRALQRHLTLAIPFAGRARIADAGACCHLTDPHLAAPVIREFLARAERGWHYPPMGMRVAA